MSTTGLVLRIERFSLHDGPGIRTTVFLKGCPLRCCWCHSPESQSLVPEPVIRPDRCLRCGQCLDACPHDAIVATGGGFETRREHCTACGTCTTFCPSGARDLAGRAITVAELIRELEKDLVFFDRSGGGVTFSGGEPLAQPAFLGEALEACRRAGLHTAVETSAFGAWRAMETAARADVLLVDLKILDDARHRAHTGVSNRPILENLARVAAWHGAVRIRVPLVPGLTDDDENLDAIGRFVRGAGLRAVDLLPYHTAGVAKYQRLGRPCPLAGLAAPTASAVDEARARLERYGLSVHVGG